MVYGRTRKRNGRRVPVPPDQWLWSPEPVHPAIVDRATWDAAQDIGAEHGTSRDGTGLSAHPAAARIYPYRGRVRCRDCRRRMSGLPQARGSRQYIYYRCPHNPASPSHAAAYPDHPRTVKAPETRLDQIAGLFFAEHVFGPGRAALLAAQLPATDAAAAADRDAQAAALTARLKRIETGQNSCILELEATPRRPGRHRRRRDARPDPRPVRRAPRRTRAARGPARRPGRRSPPRPPTPPCWTSCRWPGTSCPAWPRSSRPELFEAFDLQILWNKPGRQATVFAEITDATLQALPGILNPGQDGYDDTADDDPGDPGSVEHLFESPMEAVSAHDVESRSGAASSWIAVSLMEAGP